LGKAGFQPPTLVSGSSANFALMGLETALGLGGALAPFLVLATLGLVLAMAWRQGLRSRAVHLTLCFVGAAATSCAWACLGELFSAPVLKSGAFTLPLSIVAWVASLLVPMEILGVAARATYRILAATLAAAGALTLAILAYGEVFPFSSPILYVAQGALTVAAVVVFAAGGRGGDGRATPETRRAALGLVALVGVAHALDFGFRLASLGPSAHLAIDLVLPLVLAHAMFRHLGDADRNLRRERVAHAELRERLLLGRVVQELLFPKTDRLETDGLRFAYKHTPSFAMSGDWVAHWREADGTLVFCLGDVVGAGPQAALAVAAVTATIHQARARGASLDEIAATIDETLGAMFAHQVTTTLTAARCRSSEGGDAHEVELFNFGGLGWLHWNGARVAHVALPGSVLGGGGVSRRGHARLTLARHDRLIALTDGICGGSRELKRLTARLAADLATDAAEERTLALATPAGDASPDDRTILTIAPMRRVA
jgi:hypothetical protein